MEPGGVHGPVHDKNRPSHITAAFEKRDKKHHGEYDRHKDENGTHTRDNIVGNE